MQQDGSAAGADPRVDYRDMDGIGRKVSIADAQNECALGHILRRYLVGEVNELKGRVDAEGHALHNAGVRVGQSKVGGEYQQWVAHSEGKRPAIFSRSYTGLGSKTRRLHRRTTMMDMTRKMIDRTMVI